MCYFQISGDGRSFLDYGVSPVDVYELGIPCQEKALAAFHLDCNKWDVNVQLNMVLVPANMLRLNFGPCKKKNLFLVPAKFFFLK